MADEQSEALLALLKRLIDASCMRGDIYMAYPAELYDEACALLSSIDLL